MPIYPSAAQHPPRSRVRKKKTTRYHKATTGITPGGKYAATRHPTCLIWKRASYWGGDQKVPWAAVQKGSRNSSCLFIQCRDVRSYSREEQFWVPTCSLPTHTHTPLFSFLAPNFSQSEIFAVWSPGTKGYYGGKGYTQFCLLLVIIQQEGQKSQ